MMRLPRCSECGGRIDPDAPTATSEAGCLIVNPRTFRRAWLCDHCFFENIEALKGKDSSKPLLYKDRHDEYLTRFY